MKRMQDNLNLCQRELAEAMGISQGKVKDCHNALMEKDLVKLESFHRNDNKRSYAYLITPSGIEERQRELAKGAEA